ncbi:nucleolin [Camelus dromedarius]|uniref:Nucleolin n=1 Tax=Camelus dromedarius TaxID=9838 RepID=A0A5N4E678_CAMDR|nr:nucleolin [Camelus dromedarius]
MSEDKDNGSRDKVVIPQKNHRKVTTAPGNKVGGKKHLAPMFAEKLIPPRREGATGAKLPRDRRSAKLEGGHEERREDSDENEESENDQNQGFLFDLYTLIVSLFVLMSQAAEPPVTFRLFVGNLNFNKTVAELKTDLSEFFAKNDVAVDGVRVGLSRFGFVNFKSVDDQEKALELSELEVLGYKIKLKKPKGKETKKDGNARTPLIKNRVTQHELIEVFEDTFQIRLVSKDGMSERIAYIDFKSQADAERALQKQ